MNIAFVNGPSLPIPAVRGGAVQTLVTALIDQNEKQRLHNITVYTLADDKLEAEKERLKSTKIVEIKVSKLRTIAYAVYKLLRKLSHDKLPYADSYFSLVNDHISKENFDLVIYETSDVGFIQAKHHNNEKIAFHIHADYLNRNSYKIKDICKNTDCFICVSDFIATQIKKLDFSNDRVFVLPNAIDLEQNTSVLEEKQNFRCSIRNKYNIKDDDFVVLYCSRLSPEKGILQLMQAVNRCKDVKLLIVGGENFSSNKKTKYVQELEEEAKTNKQNIIFTGYVEHSEVTKYMCAVDVAAVPSVCNEAAPLTLVEFRSIGLPTIVSRRGGIPEYTNEKATIFVDTTENMVEQLAAAITKIKDDLQIRTNMSSEAIKDMSSYGYASYYDRFNTLVKDILSK